MDDESLRALVLEALDKPQEQLGVHSADELFPDPATAPEHMPPKFWIWMAPTGWEVSQAQIYPPDQALFEAVARSDLAAARAELRGQTVNSNSKKLNGMSVIHLATRECLRAGKAGIAVLRALLANGTDSNVFNADGQSPLMLAARDLDEPVVEMLLANGANPDLTDPQGNTALHLAVAAGASSQLVSVMLKVGADATILNDAGHTAINIARETQANDLVALLDVASPVLEHQPSPAGTPEQLQLTAAGAQYEPQYNSKGQVRCPFADVRGEELAKAIVQLIDEHKVLEVPNLELVMTRQFDPVVSSPMTKSRSGARPRPDPLRTTRSGNKKLDRRYDMHKLPTEPFMAFLRCESKMPSLWYTNGTLIARTKPEVEPESNFKPPAASPDGEYQKLRTIYNSFDYIPEADGDLPDSALSPSKAAARGREFLVRRALRAHREGINLDVFKQNLCSMVPGDMYSALSLWEEPDPIRPKAVIKHRAACQLQMYRGDSFTLTIIHKQAGGDRVTKLMEGVMLVGTFVRSPDGTWQFTAISKAHLNLNDEPTTALVNDTKFKATTESVTVTRDGDTKVTCIKLHGDLPSATVEDVVGPDLLILKLAAKGPKPVDLKDLVDANCDGVPDELHGWTEKLFGADPELGRNTLYLCPTSGEVFKTEEDCAVYTVHSGLAEFCVLDFWIYKTNPARPTASGWDVATQAINPSWAPMYDAMKVYDAPALDTMWTDDRDLLKAEDLSGWGIVHYMVRNAAKAETDDQKSKAAEVLRLALVHGADSCALGPNQQTPLHLAAETGIAELVQLLLINDGQRKATMVNQNGKKPLDLARANDQDGSHEDVIDVLHNFSRTRSPRALQY